MTKQEMIFKSADDPGQQESEDSDPIQQR